MKSRISLILAGVAGMLFTSNFAQAQTSKKVIVEHFTNTRCSICGSRNPGLKSNLASSPEVLYMSVHPSRPYSSCQLNKHNVMENDDRAKHYGVYGSTPRVVVQGEAQSPGVNFNSKSLFSDKQGGTSPIKIELTTIKKGSDSLVTRIVITTTESHSLTNLNLYAAAAEDTVFYNAPNGEKEHYNVFRKQLLNQKIVLPSAVGDSIVLTSSTANNPDWDASRMFVIAMVEHSDTKEIEQVEWSRGDENTTVLSSPSLKKSTITLYPNPTYTTLTVDSDFRGNPSFRIIGLQGQTIIKGDLVSNQLDVSNLRIGTYTLEILDKGSLYTQRFTKLNE